MNEVLLELAEQIEADAKSIDVDFDFRDGQSVRCLLNSYVRSLRLLAKTIPKVDPILAIRAKRSQEREASRKGESQYAGQSMVEAIGGNSDGTYIPVDPSMPVGAHTKIGNEVYTLMADRKLHFAE